MKLEQAMLYLQEHSIAYWETNHGLPMSRLESMIQRLRNMWIPDTLVMDEHKNNIINYQTECVQAQLGEEILI